MADNFNPNQNNYDPNQYDPSQQPIQQPESFEHPNFNQVIPNDDYNFPQAPAPADASQTAQFYNDFSQQFPDQVEPSQQPIQQFDPNQGFQPNEIPTIPPVAQADINQNPYGTYPDEEVVPAAQNKFEEKKSGSKLFFIIAGIIIVAMLGVLGFLFNSNLQSNQNSNDNLVENVEPEPQTLEEPATITFNNATTGGTGTPATLARKFNLAELPKEWVLSRFTSIDRDGNGNCTNDNICGPQADPDNDNLNNLDEYNFQTDPLVNDSDKDGLADGDETYIYYSSPVKSDSDNDTYKDGTEMANCYDPISSAQGVADKDRLDQILNAVGLKKIKEPTISTLKAVGATAEDLDKGYVEEKCFFTATEDDTENENEASETPPSDGTTTQPPASSTTGSAI
ncbi:MAG: hypothetical protein AAGF07_01745 [Patescibacteria group bacterium]